MSLDVSLSGGSLGETQAPLVAGKPATMGAGERPLLTCTVGLALLHAHSMTRALTSEAAPPLGTPDWEWPAPERMPGGLPGESGDEGDFES